MSVVNPFKSFWMAGYECSDHINVYGNRIDMLKATGHLEQLDSDYAMLKPFGIATVREGIRWSVVERHPYQYDWTEVGKRIAIAAKQNIQVIYDLCHFGLPDDLTPLHPKLPERFSSLCESFVRYYKQVAPDEALILSPINEVSFLAWLGGEVSHTTPYCRGVGWQVKYHLMKAYIAGIKTIKAIDPAIRILTVEPIINVLPEEDSSEASKAVAELNENQFQCLDILCGQLCPELGGNSAYLDILGFDYYYDSRWHHPSNRIPDWRTYNHMPAFKPLHALLEQAYRRYQRPIILSETSHPTEDRPQWIHMITEECIKVLKAEVPFWGICIYPVLDRPDWNEMDHWHHPGLWDILDNSLERILYQPYARALKHCQEQIRAAVYSESGKDSPFPGAELISEREQKLNIL